MMEALACCLRLALATFLASSLTSLYLLNHLHLVTMTCDHLVLGEETTINAREYLQNTLW